MRFPTIMKCITRLISITVIFVALATLLGIIVEIRNGFILRLMLSSTTFALLYAVTCILVLTLGPYAAFHLWNFRRKGRIASLTLIIYSLFYHGYLIAYNATLFVWVAFIAAFVGLLFLSSPSISRLFNPDKDRSKPWYRRAWEKLSAMEKLTVTISSLALIVSFFNIFFSHIYKPDKLLATITDVSFVNKEFSFLVTFINSGSAYTVVQHCDIAFASKQALEKSFFFEGIPWVSGKNSKRVPEGELILKPGEIKTIHIYSKPDVPNTLSITDSDDLMMGFLTQSMDSGGKAYTKWSTLGNAQVKDGKIVGLRRKASTYYATPNGTTSEISGEDNYGIILKLH